MKRTKKVFTNNASVAAIFAKQSQEYGCYKYNSRDGARGLIGSYFEGRDLYSYGRHYLLARVGLRLNGVNIAVVNYTSYSRSTSDHSWEAKKALIKAGFLVVEISDDNGTIRAGISDADLVKLAETALKKQSWEFKDTFRRIQLDGACRWQVQDLRADIKRHNAMVIKLKIPGLVVKIDEKAIKTGLKISRLNDIARTDFWKRRQDALFELHWLEAKQLSKLAI